MKGWAAPLAGVMIKRSIGSQKTQKPDAFASNHLDTENYVEGIFCVEAVSKDFADGGRGWGAPFPPLELQPTPSSRCCYFRLINGRAPPPLYSGSLPSHFWMASCWTVVGRQLSNNQCVSDRLPIRTCAGGYTDLRHSPHRPVSSCQQNPNLL